MSMRLLSAFLVLLCAASRTASAQLDDRFADTLLSAYVGVRDAQFGPQADDLEASGTAYGLSQQLGLLSWLRLSLGFDSMQIEPDSGGDGYRQQRDSYRVGLAPRIDAGPASLALSLEAIRLNSEESGGELQYFGTGRRSRSGFGVGGSSEFNLGQGLSVYGEATGYSLDDLEILEAMMRVSYALDRRYAQGLSLFVQGCERQFTRDNAQLREQDFRFGLSYRF
jgi:hypothetical protein